MREKEMSILRRTKKAMIRVTCGVTVTCEANYYCRSKKHRGVDGPIVYEAFFR